mmetsp:Transcript_45715/g.110761  ORF Transcript_45715/g.110761 Transcript_45715/m.110761 type:complete len:213 (+) Transcript_45715:197-835(+)|eukprot:CAMPEP_0113644552 /NCGR_PEP_ID=MMETSP0017_2-20120614/23450_1 /TAXON_ID=2856 /ORGANISM="Cylindrotheca closterium" /LENGTH=212 /DNA_ID=CAMNT_0000556173 /DNA_START=140 /DNA_END=778 /DNA_ORIENTATION=+ /assembly_acc=CAM_ASM_000147
MRRTSLITLLLLVASCASVNGFVVPGPRNFVSTRLYAELTDIGKMKASEMRKELESYGISTKSLFEKSEFVDALKKARAEGKKAVNGSAKESKSKASSKTNGDSSNSSSKSKSSSDSSEARDKRYKEALAKAKKMKVGELKKELEGRGISTKSFFEKSEFVKAYAEAVADNKSGGPGPRPEEPRDPSYKDVVMQKMSQGALMGERVIDIMAR